MYGIQVLTKKGDIQKIAVKKMGELNPAPWRVACKQKFKNHPDGWELQFATIFSDWDSNLRNTQWHPFKVVQVGEKHEVFLYQYSEPETLNA